MLCSIADVKDVMSDYGVAAYSQDSYPFLVMDSARVTRMIERAQSEILYFLTKYDGSALVASGTNEWLRWCCATFASFALSSRSGQVPSPALAARRDEYLESLREIRAGQGQIPGVSKTPEDIPAMSNLRIDPRWNVHRQRVEIPISTGKLDSSKTRSPDHFAAQELDY